MNKHIDLFNYRMLSKEEMDLFNEKGYLILKKVLTDPGLHQMREEAMKAWNAEKDSFDPSKTWLQNSLLVNIHHRAPSVKAYYFEGPMVDIASEIIGPNIKGAT